MLHFLIHREIQLVYLKHEEKFIDVCFGHLAFFLQIIDRELSDIQSKIMRSKDPESDGLFDRGEYLIGYGFVALQRYIASTYPQTGKQTGNIYKHGLKLCDELFLIEAINAGANYWKHEPEWPFDLEYGDTDAEGMTTISVNREGRALSCRQKRSFDIITKVTPYTDYTLSNLLAEIINKISKGSSLSFELILPFIEQWRNELDHASSENSFAPITSTMATE